MPAMTSGLVGVRHRDAVEGGSGHERRQDEKTSVSSKGFIKRLTASALPVRPSWCSADRSPRALRPGFDTSNHATTTSERTCPGMTATLRGVLCGSPTTRLVTLNVPAP